MLDSAKVNPLLKSEKAVANYSFVQDADKNIYLVANTITGDASYDKDVVIAAGEYLNGFLLEAWKGQKLVIDNKHLKYQMEENYETNVTAGETFLKFNAEGNQMEVTGEEPASGVYMKVTDKCVLTEKAVKAVVMVKTGAAA